MFNKKIIFSILITLLNFKVYSFDIKAPSVVLQDFLSGEILFEKDADREIYPASMTKIMTSIIAFEMLKNGEINLDDKFYLPLCDFLSMLDEVNPNFTPKIYYEQSMNYPELYKEHLDLMNNV